VSKKQTIQLSIEVLDSWKQPDQNIVRAQIAGVTTKGHYFLKKLTQCSGRWVEVYKKNFNKARKEGRSLTEPRFLLTGTWITIREFREKVTLRLLQRIGGLQALLDDKKSGLYAFLELKHESFPYEISYYNVIWFLLFKFKDGERVDLPEYVVSILNQKPKLIFDDKLYLPTEDVMKER
jgi:hypothetical protein